METNGVSGGFEIGVGRPARSQVAVSANNYLLLLVHQDSGSPGRAPPKWWGSIFLAIPIV